MVLPCHHREEVTSQVQPTIDLLENMDVLHPDILRQHGIRPPDYKGGLVFRSAIESIRGSCIASARTGREGMVADVLENLKQRGRIVEYRQEGGRRRYDFGVILQRTPDRFSIIEVKGGEGNSINISERPLWAHEFAVWSHLDGAVVNQPAHGAHAVINRLSNFMVNHGKHVDVLFFKDLLCGTPLRPCPKYSDKQETIGLRAAPDVFLFPQRIPTRDDPAPPVHDATTLVLPFLILDLFDVPPEKYADHLWEVHISLIERKAGQWIRETRAVHKDRVVDHSVGRVRIRM